MVNILHLTEDEATKLVHYISRLHREPGPKMHQTPFWPFIKQVQKAFGLVWREDRKMFLRPEEE